MEELITNHSVAISRIEDCKDDMKICKEDIDQGKICQSSTDRDIRMLEASMGGVHEQLEDLGDRVSGCHAEVRHIGTLNDTHDQALSLETGGSSRSLRRRLRVSSLSSRGPTRSLTGSPSIWRRSWIGWSPWLGTRLT